MIHLVIEGRIKNRKAYEVYAQDVINNLFPREFTKRDIVIGIRFKNIVEEGIFGQAICEERNEYLVEIGKVVMEQELREVTPREIASTIAHELVHIKQYIRGELNATMTKWLKQEVPHGPRGGIKIAYRKQPWEIEAFERETELVEFLWT